MQSSAIIITFIFILLCLKMHVTLFTQRSLLKVKLETQCKVGYEKERRYFCNINAKVIAKTRCELDANSMRYPQRSRTWSSQFHIENVKCRRYIMQVNMYANQNDIEKILFLGFLSLSLSFSAWSSKENSLD